MRCFKIAQLAVVLGALALPACSGGDVSTQSPSAAADGSPVVPQAVQMRQPASLRGFTATPEPALPSPIAGTVQTQSLRGFWAKCVTCATVIASPTPTPTPSASPKPAPSASPKPTPSASPVMVTVDPLSVRGLISKTLPPKPNNDH